MRHLFTLGFIFIIICMISSACAPRQVFGPTITPNPTNTITPTSTQTPSSTPTSTPTPSATATVEEKTINVIFRYDDYASWSNTNIELSIIDVFRQNKASVTFAVIPNSVPGDPNDLVSRDVKFISLNAWKWGILKDGVHEGVLDTALHGYSHQDISATSDSEFAGLDYNVQAERLKIGKQLMERMIEAPVTIFVPPFNTYDLNTLRALQELGFSTISGSKNGAASEDSKLNFLPATSKLTQVKSAVQAARASSDPQPVIVVLFHQYDFTNVNPILGITTIQEFSDTVSWLKSQDDIHILSISQAAKKIYDLSSHHYLLSKQLAKLNSPLYYSSASTLLEEEDTIK
jgi:predicted deacetylase